jgi:hypothetical protein
MGGRIGSRERRGDERDEYSCGTVTEGRDFFNEIIAWWIFFDGVMVLCVEIPLCAM